MPNWLRSWTLTVGAGGAGVAFSSTQGNDLRLAFEIEKTELSTPNKAKISLYNLAPATETRIANQYDNVILCAGYAGRDTLLFSGSIVALSRKNTPPDIVTEIEGCDGNFDYHTAVVNATLAAGTDHTSVVAACLASFTTTAAGPVLVAGTPPRARGRVLSGATRDILTAMARDLNAHWSIQNGQLVVCDIAMTVPSHVIPLVSAETGMIGQPEVTEQGASVHVQLLPVEIGTLFQLQTRTATISQKAGTALLRQNPSGVYKIAKVKHTGDTRGDKWTTELTGVRISP